MMFGPYPAVVTNVHDGDTATVIVDLGFDIAFKVNARIFGINAPELSTEDGKVARDYAKTLLPVGTSVRVLSHGFDKFGGRADMDVTLPDGTDFGTRMVDAGHAVRKDY